MPPATSSRVRISMCSSISSSNPGRGGDGLGHLAFDEPGAEKFIPVSVTGAWRQDLPAAFEAAEEASADTFRNSDPAVAGKS
jgi:hypothetical protein